MDDFDQRDLEELARIEGKTVDEVKRELLRERLLRGRQGAPAQSQTATLTRTPGMGDASGASMARARQEAMQAHHARDYPGSPVARYQGDDYGETAEQAAERWLEEEAELVDGVHGIGGSTAGGIFGGGPIATNIYDPEAHSRGDARVAQMAGVRLLGVVERLEQRLSAAEQPRGQLPGGPRGALPGAARRRLRGPQ